MKRLIAILCFTFVGCTQSPGRTVEGTFLVDGIPKSGVEVRLAKNLDDYSNCGDAPLAAVTDDLGKFTASATTFPFRPCFTVDGKTYSDSFVIDSGKTDPIHLRCSLPIIATGHFEDGHVCR